MSSPSANELSFLATNALSKTPTIRKGRTSCYAVKCGAADTAYRQESRRPQCRFWVVPTATVKEDQRCRRGGTCESELSGVDFP